MKLKFTYRRTTFIISTIICTIFFLTQCNSKAENKEEKATETSFEVLDKTATFENYVTAQQCASCHKEIYESHIKTAHYLTGQPATEAFIKGSFDKGKNTYSYSPDILLSMQKRDSGLYQVAYFKGQEKKAMRFDIVTGSGVMGQSFLTWRGNKLFQLPITYFTAANKWANSPGFPTQKVMIDRPVTLRCMECHLTYAEGIGSEKMEPLEFDKNKIVFGVDCQKCHGPAKEHVNFHTANPEIKTAKHIIGPIKLSRSLQIDMCALCHGGNIQKTKPSFSFLPGKKLSDYFTMDTLKDVNINTSAVDVHGNQVGLLMSSKCYKMTNNLTCNTCHNPHKNERGQLELFSQKCIGCHNTADKKFQTITHQKTNLLEKNCIDCHMPAQPSKSIAVFLEGEETPKASLLRTHFIGIYPDKK